MKFLYEYRTKSNELRDGVVSASDRDAAFLTLRSQGIRPARMVEAPGIFNKLFGKGKRWIAIVILCGIAVLLAVLLYNAAADVAVVSRQIENSTRRQIIGDAALIDSGIRSGWKEVFKEEGERFLASFAIPGVPAGVRNTTEVELQKALHRKVLASDSDGIEVRQIKSMVEGMKEELREYIRDGGTISEYGRELVKRQEQEIAYYQRAKKEIDKAISEKMPEGSVSRMLRIRNEKLRKLGIKPVVLSENAMENLH